MINEERAILENSVKNPNANMTMVRIGSLNEAKKLIESLKALAKFPLFEEIEFAPDGVKASIELFKKARECSTKWEQTEKDKTGILFIIDTSGAFNITKEEQINFWDTMNAQRELWGSLQSYTIFILSPEQYEKMLIISHHLTDWIPLKIDLIEPASSKERLITTSQNISADISGNITPKDAETELNNLWKNFKEAEQRGEKSLIRRFLLPAFRLAIIASDIKKAEEIKNSINEENIQKSDLIYWYILNFDFYFDNYENDKAEEYLLKLKNAALKADDKHNIALSYFETGRLAFSKSENKKALEAFQEAMSLYKQLKNILGEANCINRIGKIHLINYRNKDALKAFQEAMNLYKKIDSQLGIANCIYSIGDIYLRNSMNKDALDAFQEAMTIYKNTGSLLGAANCIYHIGDIYFRESINEKALESFQEAINLYKKIGDISGQGNCFYSIGRILFASDEFKKFEDHFEHALKLYQKINDSYSIAVIYFEYGKLMKDNKAYENRGIAYIKKAADIFDLIGMQAQADNCRGML